MIGHMIVNKGKKVTASVDPQGMLILSFFDNNEYCTYSIRVEYSFTDELKYSLFEKDTKDVVIWESRVTKY